jgi:hypothetical protein
MSAQTLLGEVAMRNLLVAALVLIAGVVGLFLPVQVFDGTSTTVPCGNAVVVDHVSPNAPAPPSAPVIDQAIPHADLTAACESAISGRRHWAVPLVIVGVVGVAFAVFSLGRRGAKRVR